MLGKLEELTLLAAIRSGPESTPAAIYERLLESAGAGQKTAAFGAVYTTINRLVGKGFLIENGFTGNNGKVRRTISISGAGRVALSDSMRRVVALGGFGLVGAHHA